MSKVHKSVGSGAILPLSLVLVIDVPVPSASRFFVSTDRFCFFALGVLLTVRLTS